MPSSALWTSWGWTGLIYCCGFLSRITPLGYAFGALFAMQSAFILHAGVLHNDVKFWTHNGQTLGMQCQDTRS